MEKPQPPRAGRNPRLVDTHSKQVYRLQPGRQIVASHAHLVPDTQTPSAPPPLLLPPTTERDHYCCDVEVGGEEERGLVRVLDGVCRVNGEVVTPGGEPMAIPAGAFLDLGTSFQLQLVCSSADVPVRRMLPQTPGKVVTSAPPAKPKRHQHNSPRPPLLEQSNTPSTTSSFSVSVDLEGSQLESGLRSRLQRIAQEVVARRIGYNKRKPPPPYEQVGNSIGYQLLHQGHKDVTSTLIDSLYPALKMMEREDPSLQQTYKEFLETYAKTQKEGARPDCLHPTDVPCLHFLVDITVHLCSMPKMNALAVKFGPLWLHLVAILTTSCQNQHSLVERRGASHILSCMHLSIVSSSLEFQRHGWTALGNVVGTPVQPGKKPALTEPSLVLALSLVEQQLGAHSSHAPLATSILHFLSCTATTAKSCLQTSEENPTYTPEQAKRILTLFQERRVLRHVMKVPEELRRNKAFDSNYCALVRALVPTRSRSSGSQPPITPTETTPTKTTPPSAALPPRKPQRKNRLRRSTVASGESSNVLERAARGSHKKQVSTMSLDQTTIEHHLDSSSSLTSLTSLDSSESVDSPLPSHQRSKSLDFESDGRLSPLRQNGVSQCEDGPTDNGVSVSDVKEADHIPRKDEKHTPLSQPSLTTSTLPPSSISTSTQSQSSLPTSTQSHFSIPTSTQSHSSLPTSTQSHSSLPTSPLSLPTSPQFVSSPDSLANDVQSLLNELRMPVISNGNAMGERGGSSHSTEGERGGGSNGNAVEERGGSSSGDGVPVKDARATADEGGVRPDWGSEQMVVVPRVSRDSHYYRHSRKRRRGMLIKAAPDEEPEEELTEGRCRRMSWDPTVLPQSLAGQRELQWFEKSGEFLSSQHAAIEEVCSGHSDVMEIMKERAELLESVLQLWQRDKGLQASTNTVQGCFSHGNLDIPLFIDIVDCFIAVQGPWTLAVCVVLLPVLRQLIGSQQEQRHVETLSAAVAMIVHRFSDSIQACKSLHRSKRLSAVGDRQQRAACYQELHATHVTVEERLGQKCDSRSTTQTLQNLLETLNLYETELSDS